MSVMAIYRQLSGHLAPHECHYSTLERRLICTIEETSGEGCSTDCPMGTEKQSKMNVLSSKPVKLLPASTSILDYPESLSMYERESLAGEARLTAERKANKRPKLASH
jgi:hypothetical protein